MKLLSSILVVMCFSLAGCFSDSSDKLVGAWKSEKINSWTEKPDVLIFTKSELYFKGEKGAVFFEEVANADQINVINAAKKHTMIVARDITKDSVTFDVLYGAKQKYVRITQAEAEQIINTKAKEISGKNAKELR